MLDKISDLIKRNLQKYVSEQDQMQSALSFGVNMALYTIFSTAGLLLISLIIDSFLQGIIIIATCYLNQTIGGGYHASTHMKCFLSMSFFLTLGILFGKLRLSYLVLCIIGLISGALLLFHPVVLHPNRSFLKNRLPYFIKRSKYVATFEMLLLFVLPEAHDENRV